MDGYATWTDLARLSTQHRLRASLAAGHVVRVGRGRYALPELPLAWEAAATVGGVVSHLSAALELGLAVIHKPVAVHVTVPRHAHRRAPTGVVLHRSDLPPEERRRVATSPLRTVLDCAATLPFAEGLAVADSALREGLVGDDDLIEAARLVRVRRAPAVRAVAMAADGRAANPFESSLRATVLLAGFRGFVPQQPVRLLNGRTVYVDLGDEARRIAIEADSFAHHGTREALRDDCRRYDELLRVGWLVLRFAWEHLAFDAPWVAAVVGDVVEGRDRLAVA
jgi:very-short-patch-repair endonuclease